MKVPENLDSFKHLIRTANHRERFVFDIPKDKKGYHYTENCRMEVYITHLSGPIDNPVVRSVLYQTVGIEGKFNKQWNCRRSCQYHCTTDREWECFWSIIN